MKRLRSAENGKKGGRPKAEEIISTFIIPDFDSVVLTEKQYNKLIKIYGTILFKQALSILQSWLEKSPEGIKHKGKNNYAYFRTDGWVINEARQLSG